MGVVTKRSRVTIKPFLMVLLLVWGVLLTFSVKYGSMAIGLNLITGIFAVYLFFRQQRLTLFQKRIISLLKQKNLHIRQLRKHPYKTQDGLPLPKPTPLENGTPRITPHTDFKNKNPNSLRQSPKLAADLGINPTKEIKLFLMKVDGTVHSRDAVFMDKLLAITYKNMGNESFSIEDLANHMGLSHSQLHRRIKSLLNQSSSHFLRSVRLHRANELLRSNSGSVSEIAYLVGYSDPGYFSKVFRRYFGILPSQVRSGKGQKHTITKS